MYRITNIYVLAAFGTIGGALFGFDVSSMSAWIGVDTYTDYFGSPDSNLQGGITASMSAGSFAGSIAAGWISDFLGRRGALMVASLVWIIGAIVQCSAQNVTHLVAGRVVSGLAVGVTSSQTCVYLSELAPARIRGRIVGIQQWAIEWGILIMYLIAYGCAVGVSGPAAFRICWGIQAVPGLILFIALFFFPESPRWLAGKERWEEALETLAILHGNGNSNDPVVQIEFEEVQQAARVAHEAKDVSFLALFGPRIWKRTMCGMSVQMWQQLLGGNVAMYYVVYIFEMAGMTGNTTLWSSAIQYVIFLVTTGLMLPFIDRVGRRILLLIGSITCMIVHFVIAGVMAGKGHPVNEVNGNANLTWEIKGRAGMAVIAFSYIFTAIYGFTWAPAAWIYASEVFPLKYRAKGVGLSASANWIFNFALAYFVAPAFHNIQWKTYIIFGVFCFVMTFHVFFMYPETAGRSLEEMDMVFDTGVKPWRTKLIDDKFEDEIEKHKAVAAASVAKDTATAHEEVV
ncbi:Major facilitator superfamily domain general substrate transporter [Penicillium macrosclerotiorum]|uniref:Major facilitator superfamily domain general substrate transporter n=1 Tax=Penicillium macrosclerotiorum TaxID=303699 RepID=UPI002546BDAD|nr:Major facilitator superfamily domain general substrate transporter [Penicillium macrosclerotiorum]KAJ5693461.1 Major facilitator superfamily domain general substrate transporter [Penicillium macrosclerotiorum]